MKAMENTGSLIVATLLGLGGIWGMRYGYIGLRNKKIRTLSSLIGRSTVVKGNIAVVYSYIVLFLSLTFVIETLLIIIKFISR